LKLDNPPPSLACLHESNGVVARWAFMGQYG